jgi:hypothetical protein
MDDNSDTTPIVRNNDKPIVDVEVTKLHGKSKNNHRRAGRPRTRPRYDLRSRAKATRIANLVQVSGPNTDFFGLHEIRCPDFPTAEPVIITDRPNLGKIFMNSLDRLRQEQLRYVLSLDAGATRTTILGIQCSSISIAS